MAAEAEEVIVDAARHVTARALALWRRRAAGAPAAATDLAALKPRLELLIAASLGRAVPLRAATPHPPPTLLARWFRRRGRPYCPGALPATDGRSVLLPPTPAAEMRDAAALDWYRIGALHHAVRCIRGITGAYAAAGTTLVEDLVLISELAAADAALARDTPGLRAATRALSLAALAARPPAARLGGTSARVEALYQGVLRGEDRVPAAADAGASLAWGRAEAARLDDGGRDGGLRADDGRGEVLPADAAAGPARLADAAGADAGAAPPPRSAPLGRRPRVRAGADDEDDAASGPILVQSSPPSEHVEDPHGLQRPVDRDEDADLGGTAESLGDLETARLVTTPGTPREVLAGEALPPGRTPLPARPAPAAGAAYAYPEWDWARQAYLPGAALVRETIAEDGSAAWVEATLARHRLTLQRVRRRFEALRARRAIAHRQPDGDDVDLAAFVAQLAERRAQRPRDERVYLEARPARRDLALLILLDRSGSTDAWVDAGRRIIDVEKEALLVVATALQALALDHAIHAFSGHGPSDVRVWSLKRFDERVDASLWRRIAGLEPEQFTRLGAAVRHATAQLARRPHRHRLLLLLSDGKPNDCDRYEGRYGVEDARQALAEARLQGVSPFCVSVAREPAPQLPLLFGPHQYTVVRDPARLAGALVEWLRAVALSAR